MSVHLLLNPQMQKQIFYGPVRTSKDQLGSARPRQREAKRSKERQKQARILKTDQEAFAY